MKKRLLNLILAFGVVLALFTVSAFAAETVASGYCGGEGAGSNLTWTLTDDGLLSINGKGTMKNFSEFSDVPWAKYGEQITELYIQNGVTTIGYGAFNGCGKVSSVVIPDSVTTVGTYAFYNCDALTSVTIPDSVTTVGGSVFAGCTELKTAGPVGGNYNIQFGWTKKIPGNAFSSANGLRAVVIPSGVTNIGDTAFSGCTGLFSVSLPESLTSIGWSAFSGCTGLTGVTIPDSVTNIDWYAFSNCTGLTSITIPAGVSTIGWGAFYDCVGLKTAGPTGGNYNIKFGWTDAIPENAFSGCTGLTRVTFPTGISSIEREAFSDCTSLTRMTIPDSVTYVGTSAFSGCTALTNVTIPAGVTSTGTNLFSGCTGLTSAGPAGGDYSVQFGWQNAIPAGAFSGCASLTQVAIPSGIEAIGNSAFYDCTGLTKVTIPSSVTSIGEGAFEDCTALTEITIPGSVTSIGRCAFEGCTALTGLVISNGVTEIGSSAFQRCTALTAVVIPDGVKTIGDSAFSHCTGLTAVVIPGSVTEMGWSVFGGCTGLQTAGPVGGAYNIQYGWTTAIPAYAFQGSNLIAATISDGITTIGGNAFRGCYSLLDVTFPASVTTIGSSAFNSCSSLTDMNLPAGVTSIGAWAYAGCTSLQEARIPSGVTTISDSLFKYCYALTTLRIPAGVTEISADPGVLEGTALHSVYYGGTEEQWKAVKVGGTTIGEMENGLFEDGVLHCSVASGTCGESLTWDLSDDGVLFINGVGDMADYAAGEAPWSAYAEQIKALRVENGVTSIGRYAFAGCAALTDVTIPGSVETIERFAFSGCAALTDLVLPGSVAAIENSAFADCTALADVYYKVTSAQPELPEIGTNNDHLTGATVHVYVVGGLCGKTGEVDLRWVLDMNGQLTVFGTGEMGENIPWKNYSGQIKEVRLKPGVTAIAASAFAGCSELMKLTIPAGVTSIGASAFSGCAALESVTIPDSVTAIGSYAFSNCDALTSVTIPAGVTAIESYTFNGCNVLKQVKLPDGLTTIGDNAFECCTYLREIVLPASVTTIGSYAFGRCYALEWVVIPAGVETIANGTFDLCWALRDVVIPASVKSIGAGAFYDCDDLKNVYYPGTEEEWNAISIDVSGSKNDCLTNAADHYYGAYYGYCGAQLVWALNAEGKLTVFGIGAMEDYGEDQAPWHPYAAGIKTAEIRAEGATVGSNAFRGCTALAEVSLSGTVTSIGDYAFFGCTALTGAAIPSSVEAIGEYAFSGCAALTDVSVPASVETLGTYAFSGCTAVIRADLSAHTIGRYAFAGCVELAQVTFENSVSMLGELVFSGCPKLTTAGPVGGEYGYLLGWTDAIPANAFADNATLTAVVIPDGVTEIGAGAFRNCTALTSVTVPASVTAIGDSAFAGCTGLTVACPIDMVLEDSSDEEVADGEAAEDTADSVTGYRFGWTGAIPANAFANCTGLTRAILPDGVRTIGSSAFSGCAALTSVNIPASVTAIGENAFLGCAGLKTAGPIDLTADDAEDTGDEPADDTEEGAAEETAVPYNIQFGWTKAIPDNAFDGCTSLTAVTIPEGITTIGSYAFRGCTGLTELLLPDGVTTIGKYAFRRCTGLTRVIVPDSVTSIGSYAFYDCTGLTSAGPVGGEYGYQFAWEDVIPAHAFSGCKGLTDVTIPASIMEIGSHAFAYCTGMKKITLPEGVETIGDYAFFNCTGLNKVSIPVSVTVIKTGAFSDTNLTSVYYSGGKVGWSTIEQGEKNEPLKNAALYCTVLPHLSTPTDLVWGRAYAYNGIAYVEVPGMISWKRGALDQSKYTICIYREAGGEEEAPKDEETTGGEEAAEGEENTKGEEQIETAALEPEEPVLVRKETVTFDSSFKAVGLSKDYFITGDFESGRYYYTVQAVGDGVDYLNSEEAKSASWYYAKPGEQLEKLPRPAWKETEDEVLLTWTLPEDTSALYGLEYELYYSETADGARTQVGSTSMNYVEPEVPLNSSLVRQYGLGCYWFRVRVFSKDVTTVTNGAWSELSKPYMLTETVGKINERLSGIDTETAKQEDILKAVQGINTQSMALAMVADREGDGTLALIRQLEQAIGTTSSVNVESSMEDIFDADAVSIVGAGLNASPSGGSAVSMRVSRTDDAHEVVLPEQYFNAIQFSMHLDNAVDADEEAAGQQLEVPVRITLPVPTNINPAFLSILHRLDSTGELEEIKPHLYQDENGRWMASFVVTSFSSFALVETTIEAKAGKEGVLVTARFAVELPVEGNAICAVYDADGRLVKSVFWNLNYVTAGVNYIPVLCDGTQVAEVKLFLVDPDNGPLYAAASYTIEQ